MALNSTFCRPAVPLTKRDPRPIARRDRPVDFPVGAVTRQADALPLPELHVAVALPDLSFRQTARERRCWVCRSLRNVRGLASRVAARIRSRTSWGSCGNQGRTIPLVRDDGESMLQVYLATGGNILGRSYVVVVLGRSSGRRDSEKGKP